MLNKVTLIGNLGHNPRAGVTKTGNNYCVFSLATDMFGDRKNTQWHDVFCFEKTAELANKYLQKGSKCYVEGRLQYTSNGCDGMKQKGVRIIATSIILLSPRPSAVDGTQSQSDGLQQTEPTKSLNGAFDGLEGCDVIPF